MKFKHGDRVRYLNEPTIYTVDEQCGCGCDCVYTTTSGIFESRNLFLVKQPITEFEKLDQIRLNILEDL